VEASFDGGVVTSDADGLLLGFAWKALALPKRFAVCFIDKRDPDLIEHSHVVSWFLDEYMLMEQPYARSAHETGSDARCLRVEDAVLELQNARPVAVAAEEAAAIALAVVD
jgi:hypothetical protein